MRQLKLLTEKKYAGRKIARAISIRGANHIVFKARRPVLRRHFSVIRGLLRETQDRFGVRIPALAIMPDHIHLLVKVSSREQFGNALRFFAGMVARRVASGGIWHARAWSRPVQWGRDLRNAFLYVWRNPYKARIETLADDAYLVDGILQV